MYSFTGWDKIATPDESSKKAYFAPGQYTGSLCGLIPCVPTEAKPYIDLYWELETSSPETNGKSIRDRRYLTPNAISWTKAYLDKLHIDPRYTFEQNCQRNGGSIRAYVTIEDRVYNDRNFSNVKKAVFINPTPSAPASMVPAMQIPIPPRQPASNAYSTLDGATELTDNTPF